MAHKYKGGGMAHQDQSGGGGRGALSVKEGRSAGKLMSGGGKRCSGGRAYKPAGKHKGPGRSGGSLVGGGGGGKAKGY